MRPARTKMGARLRRSPLFRYVRRELRDPEVRSAARDVAVIYGVHKGLKKIPRIESAVRTRLTRRWAGPGDAMSVLREAHFGRPSRRGVAERVKAVGKRALRFKRAGALKRLAATGKSALRILSVVK